MPKKKTVVKKVTKKKVRGAKAAARSKEISSKSVPKVAAKRKKVAHAKATKKSRAPIRGTASPAGRAIFSRKGLGADTGGQSGDTEGLSTAPRADSESVEELAEEGQAFEAEAVSGVEGAPDADEGEVTTREVPEDDVPEEYSNDD